MKNTRYQSLFSLIALNLCFVGVTSAQLPPAIVLNSRDASISLIDQQTYAEIGRIDVGKEPHHLYPTADGKQLIVANAASNDLHYLDPSSGKIIKRVRNIDDPYQLAFSPDQKWFVSAALRLAQGLHAGRSRGDGRRRPAASAAAHPRDQRVAVTDLRPVLRGAHQAGIA